MPKIGELTKLRQEVAQLKEELATLARTQRLAIQERTQDARFKEHPDPTPVEVPVGMGDPPSIQELMQRYIRTEVSRVAQEDDYGTFEEEDDFEPDDEELLPLSGFEVVEMEPEFETVDAAPPESTPVDPPQGSEATAEAPQGPSETEATPSMENTQLPT